MGLYLEREVGPVRDEDLAVPVEDLPPRRLHPDLADAVVVGEVEVLVARQHLQVPEAQEDHREDRDCEGGDDRHPDRER